MLDRNNRRRRQADRLFCWVRGMVITSGDNTVFYQSDKWKRFRQRILRRDKYMCQRCKRYGRMTEAIEVHHIEHLEDAPEKAFDPRNVISLCHRCHNAEHPEKADTMNQNKARWRYV